MENEPIKRGRGRPRKPKPDVVPPKRKAGRPLGALGVKAQEKRMSATEYASTYLYEAFDTWAAVMRDEDAPHAARNAAAAHLVDRVLGKPMQAVEMTGKDGGPIQHEATDPAMDNLTVAQREALAALGATQH